MRAAFENETAPDLGGLGPRTADWRSFFQGPSGWDSYGKLPQNSVRGCLFQKKQEIILGESAKSSKP